jgi:hypothetical protein
MSTNDEPIQYNPYSLYYIHAINEGENITEETKENVLAECSIKKLRENPTDEEGILKSCLANAYHKNKEKAIEYVESSNKQSSTQQNYEDVKLDYNEELMNTMNLLLGSLVLGGLIYKHAFSP